MNKQLEHGLKWEIIALTKSVYSTAIDNSLIAALKPIIIAVEYTHFLKRYNYSKK